MAVREKKNLPLIEKKQRKHVNILYKSLIIFRAEPQMPPFAQHRYTPRNKQQEN